MSVPLRSRPPIPLFSSAPSVVHSSASGQKYLPAVTNLPPGVHALRPPVSFRVDASRD